MKKSNLIILAGTLTVFVTFAATNLKLKSEYDKKNLKEYMVFTPLPAFHYIKDNFTSEQDHEQYFCNVSSGDKYGTSVGFFEKDMFDCFAKNDTLFIQKKTDANSIVIINGGPFRIFSGPLKGVFTNAGSMTINGRMADSFLLKTANDSHIRLYHLQTKLLSIDAGQSAGISVMQTDTIPSLQLRLQGRSSFTADNIVILNKKLQLGDSASLVLTGRSLADFGIKKN
jgi:hypothetical protein